MAKETKGEKAPQNWRDKAKALLGEKRWDEAIALLLVVIPTLESEKDKASAHKMLGTTFANKEEYDRALVEYNKVVELGADAATYNNRGFVYDKIGEYDRAIADYNEAIKLDPNNVSAHNNRGVSYKDKGEYDLALSDLDKAIKIAPRYYRPYAHRGTIHKKMGNHDLAVADLEQAIQLSLTKGAEMDEQFIETMQEIIKLYNAMAEVWSQEIEAATGYKAREEEHDNARKEAKENAKNLLGYLFAFYVVSIFSFFLFKHNPDNYWESLPWITALLLATSPIVWLVRILNREQTRHLALREDAYANRLMNRLLFQQPQNQHMEKLIQKYFDHHDLRGSAQLILGADKGQRVDETYAESIAARAANIIRRDGET